MRCEHCGCENKTSEGGKPRSPDQLRRFFAIIRKTYQNWPESHAVQFADETECRKWLTAKAGYYDVVMRMPPPRGIKATTIIGILEAGIKAAGGYAIVVEHKKEVCVIRPKSISFVNMGHNLFSALNADVEAVVLSETGIDTDGVLK